MDKEIFKAYDIRGIYPDQIDEEAVYNITKAYIQWLAPKRVALARDVRTSGKDLMEAAKKAFLESGVEVFNIGVVTTDILYFSVAHFELDGGMIITASHNPKEYNGIKLVRENAIPLSAEKGLLEIRKIVEKGEFEEKQKGSIKELNVLKPYIKEILGFIEKKEIANFKVVVNPNFGGGGKVIERIAKDLGLELEKINFEENGEFPKGKPDPLLVENRQETSQKVIETKADFGVAWDADADRCFFFDEKGQFVPGYYLTALLSEIILKKYPGEKIIHDPRLCWAIKDTVKKQGGVPIEWKVGHSLIKEKMRSSNAVFAGENSGHYYFRDFYFCDNGMIPFLLILEELSKTNKKMSEYIDPYRKKYPASNELNFTILDKEKTLLGVEKKYQDADIKKIDGLSFEYPSWRFNLRVSNTEPVVRLNLEAKDKHLLEEKIKEVSELLQS